MNAKTSAILKGVGSGLLLVIAKGAAEVLVKYCESLAPAVNERINKAIRDVSPVEETEAREDISK